MQGPLHIEDPLIDAAVRPLGDNAEHRLAAAGYLEGIRDVSAPGTECLIARWKAVDSRKTVPKWLWLGVILLVSLTAFIWTGYHKSHMLRDWEVLRPLFGEEDETRLRNLNRRVAARMTAEQRLAIFGGEEVVDRLTASKLLVTKYPDDPARFVHFASLHLREHDQLPADFIEIATRIDPDNAWFVYLLAAVESKDSVSKIRGQPRTSRMVDGKKIFDPLPSSIDDPERHARALERIGKAGLMGGFETYHQANSIRELSQLPMRNLEEYMDSVRFLGGSSWGNSLRLRILLDAISAELWQAGEKGDLRQYGKAKGDWLRLIRHLERAPVVSVLDELVIRVLSDGLLRELSYTSSRLDLTEESRRWQAMADEREQQRRDRFRRTILADDRPMDGERIDGTLLGANMLTLQQQMKNPPPLYDKDLRPGRMIDHEFWSWAGCGLVSLLMVGMMICLKLYQIRVPVLVKGLARRFEDLLELKDWLWIVGAGLVLPLFYVMAVYRLAPIGGHSYSVAGTYYLLPFAHFLALALLWWVSLGIVIRKRITKRALPFRFRNSSPLAWLALISAMTFVPMIGWSVSKEIPESFWLKWMSEMELLDLDPSGEPWRFRVALGLLAVPVLWLMCVAMVHLIGSKNGMLIHAVTARVMIVGCGIAILVSLIAACGFHAMEQFWYLQDTPLKADANTPTWSRYEYQCAIQMRKELRDSLKDYY